MCTVSFIPIKNGVILTSNRDEHVSRGIAQYPEFYMLNGRKLASQKIQKQAVPGLSPMKMEIQAYY